MLDEYGVRPDEFEMDSFDDLVVVGGAVEDYFIVTTGCRGGNCDTAPVWELVSGERLKHNSFHDFIFATIDSMQKTQR
ncbi:hypothetical protein [Nocardia blacklockiae]|uniref:hypothetical protein n=1 Tax=Nocardia blacklockiae TaxID=480036 RepID=UPI001895130A|nr:hypothetical protein [Nocardia blacklockiae]MBF6171316.1 hypothetical protein [Nocardia blacklockiae]